MAALEKIYKAFSSGINLFISSFISILKIAFLYRINKKLPKAIKESCAILGNGPSLTDSFKNHLDFIKKCDILCVNNFAQSEYFQILKPDDYVLLDGYYFLFDNEKYDRDDVKLTFEILKTINWPINIYLPTYARNSYLVNSILKKNTFIRICFFNHIVVEGYNWFKFPVFKHGIGMPQCQNVLSASTFLSINRGFRDIYIFGADHSWHEQFAVSENNRIAIANDHFYDKTKTGSVPPEIVFKKEVTVSDFFLSLYKVFQSYYILNDYAIYRKTKVYNSSHKSCIDAFERKEIK
ncbi:MAG: hypothetical protein V4511_13010 [Bacteroidota bacterium]